MSNYETVSFGLDFYYIGLILAATFPFDLKLLLPESNGDVQKRSTIRSNHNHTPTEIRYNPKSKIDEVGC